MTELRAFSADGHAAEWETWDGRHGERLSLTWENEAWTANGTVERERVQYVLRLSPTWRVRQFLLFRDLDEPDLWLAVDAQRHWGEVNGSYRRELDGCVDVELACTPFTPAVPIRRLGLDALAVGEAAEFPVIEVDVETLAAEPVLARYERLDATAWRRTSAGATREFTIDELGLVVEEPGRYRRS